MDLSRFTTNDDQTAVDPLLQLKEEMIRNGVVPNDSVVFTIDGQLHRFGTRGERVSNTGHSGRGFYSLTEIADGLVVGIYGDWSVQDKGIKFVSDRGRPLTGEERSLVNMEQDRQRRLAEQEAKRHYEESVRTSQGIWAGASKPTMDHPYLVRKGVGCYGLRQSVTGDLIVPVYVDGLIRGVQYIGEDGSKKFNPGSYIKGGYYVLRQQADSPVYLCEGYATAASVLEALDNKATVAMSFSAGNLEAAARSLQALPENIGCPLVIVADNDKSGTGQKYAQVAATAVGGRVVIPPELGDANDFVQQGGDLKELLTGEKEAPLWFVPEEDFSTTPAPIQYLVKGYLARGAMHMVFGESGAGKTFVVLDWVLRVAGGANEWCGHKVRHGDVVYLAGEGHTGLKARIAGWKRAHGITSPLNLWISPCGLDLDTSRGLTQVTTEIDRAGIRPVLIVVDTLHRFLSGDENSAQDSRAMLASCGYLQNKYGAGIVLVHHTGTADDKRVRGSTSWRGATDIETLVSKAKKSELTEEYMPQASTIKVTQTKVKDGVFQKPKLFYLEPYTLEDWVDEDGEATVTAVLKASDGGQEEKEPEAGGGELTDRQQAMVDCLPPDGTPLGREELKGRFIATLDPNMPAGGQRVTFKRVLEQLISRGLITQSKQGYFLTRRWSM